VAVLVAGLLLPALAFAQSPGSDTPSASESASSQSREALSPKNAAIKLLRKEITDPISWEDVSFEFVLDWLREQGDANVVVNFNALEVVGVSREATVQGLALRDVKVADVLDEVLDQLVQQGGEEITYRGVGNTLRISTKQDFNRKLHMRFYDVTELLFRIPDSIDAPEIDLTQIQQQGGGGGGGGGQGTPVFTEGGGGGGEDEREVTDEEVKRRMEDLQLVIEDSIEPESWDALGGRGTIRSYNRTLVVRNSIEVHEQIAGFFALGH
jgi:hypothetical protein